jgi:hypothetical protein
LQKENERRKNQSARLSMSGLWGHAWKKKEGYSRRDIQKEYYISNSALDKKKCFFFTHSALI